MSILKALGVPTADEDGTLWIRHEVKNGVVRLTCDGHAFVECAIVDGNAVVRVIDCDTGVKHESNIQTLCWRR